MAMLEIFPPCFRPPVVRVVPGHGGKILTTEITEDTENRWLALFIRRAKEHRQERESAIQGRKGALSAP
jgi:hypothetical protein